MNAQLVADGVSFESKYSSDVSHSKLSGSILVKLMKNVMEFHEMDVTGRYNFYSFSGKVVREKVVDLEIVHISSKHTTPKTTTLEAGRRVKGDRKNDM